MGKGFALILIGFLGGLWVSWPGILMSDRWICAMTLIKRSRNQATPIQTALALPPKYFLNRRSYRGILGKARILGDTCFR